VRLSPAEAGAALAAALARALGADAH